MSPHDRLALGTEQAQAGSAGRLAGTVVRTGSPPEPETSRDGGPAGGRSEAVRYCISHHLI
ncbi:hypothetical protein [Rhodoplanes azumiensis]|uniref:Uncharacterized protein n=1 Tax=Rhodoplanes azumiensis TaxID=1897628 RepID=A0ABW5AMR5_9BRAD